MPPTPVGATDHSDEFEQLAGLAALRVLDGEERATFDAHAAGCERCQLLVRLDKESLRGLALIAPEMEPSPGFKARLMQRARAELAASAGSSAAPAAQAEGAPATPPIAPVGPDPIEVPPPTVSATPGPVDTSPPIVSAPSKPIDMPPPTAGGTAPGVDWRPARGAPGERDEPRQLRPRSNVVPLYRRPWAAALAAVLVLGIGTASVLQYLNQTVATYALSGSAPGTAVVIVRRSGSIELELRDVPDPPPGHVYEAWVIPPGRQPVAAGTTPRGRTSLPLPAAARGSTVAITEELAPGAEAPSGAPLMAAVVAS